MGPTVVKVWYSLLLCAADDVTAGGNCDVSGGGGGGAIPPPWCIGLGVGLGLGGTFEFGGLPLDRLYRSCDKKCDLSTLPYASRWS